MKKVIVLIIVGLITLSGIVALVGISASNKEISLRSKITAQTQNCEAYYDKLWKILSQKAQVADQYKSAFKDIYSNLMEGRYSSRGSSDGSLMKFIKESNPNFDPSLYKDLMNSIEAERTGFFLEQKKLIDLSNEHRILLRSFPSSLFIGDRPDITIKVISSDKTKSVMSTGEENDVSLFK